MRMSLRLSAIALLTTALTILPAHAVSLNLGGGDAPVVDLGNGNTADATASVDTGNLLGNGSGGTSANAAVDVQVGNGGGGSDASAAIDVNLGGGNGNDASGAVDINLGGSGGNGGVVGGGGSLLDLSGNDDVDAVVEADLGGGGLLDLGSTGSIVDLGSGGGLLDLGGSGGPGGTTGGDGPGGGNGGDSGGGGSGIGTGGNSGSGSGLFAASGTDACLGLTAAQLDQLMARHDYNRATFNSWASARSLRIVEVKICNADVARMAAAADGSANVARLQAFLAAQAKVRAGLQSRGYSSGDVIAAEHSGEMLIVYVI